jgi:hypothetical protein
MKNFLMLLGLVTLVLGLEACGRKTKTTAAAAVENPSGTGGNPRTDDDGDIVDDNEDWNTVDPTVGYAEPDYDQIYTPSCSASLTGFNQEKLENFFFLDFSQATSGSLKFCLSIPSLSPLSTTLRLEYQHSIAAYPNTLFITRYTTKSAYLLEATHASGVFKATWMNQDGFIFVKANLTSGDSYTGDVRYTNMPDQEDAVMASNNFEAACLSGANTSSTCARSRILHRAFFAKLKDNAVPAAQKTRIRAILDHYYFNSYSSDFETLGVYSNTLGANMVFDFSDAQQATIEE